MPISLARSRVTDPGAHLKHVWLWVVCSLIAGIGLLVSGSVSMAYNRNPKNMCGSFGTNVTYSFWNSGDDGWTSPQRARVEEALANLANSRGRDGFQLVTFTRLDPGQPAEIRFFRRDLGLGKYGGQGCVSGNAYIDINYDGDGGANTNTNAFLWQVASHETLHALGANHGGKTDSYTKQYDFTPSPTRLSTCQAASTFPNYANIDPDASAWMMSSMDKFGSGTSGLNTDHGFENGYDIWWARGGGTLSRSLFGAAEGSWTGQWTAPATSSAYSLQGRASTIVGTTITGSARWLRARALMRSQPSSYTGTGRVALYLRTRDYTGTTTCSTWPGITNDPNGAITWGAWFQAVVSPLKTLTTTNQMVHTPYYIVPTVDAVDVSVWMEGSSRNLFDQSIFVYVDNMTVETYS